MAENFDLIFGQSASSQYAWNDSDYQNGWGTVGSTPPTAEQFDALQRRSDKKAQELNNALTPLVNQNTASNRQPVTAYVEKDIRYSTLLPTGWYLECTTAGTSASADITLPTPLVENATITDGTVTWKVRKISSADGMPIGAIIAFGGNGAIPSGYLLCDGAAYSRTAFPDLFACIGTDYGSGDGSTTFNVPDANQAKRFLQGDTVAGTVKEAGLPNITGGFGWNGNNIVPLDKFSGAIYGENNNGARPNSDVSYSNRAVIVKLNASLSNPIYGNSTTVQPPALTTRYIIKAFDGQTADSALVDITQYEQELAHKAEINQSNMVHHRDVITTSGTYTAPATGLYKITIKGGGGGGADGAVNGNVDQSGGGGGEGGTTIAYEKLIAGDSVSVVIGAGGASGTSGASGGTTSADINNNTYTATGGTGGRNYVGGHGGDGTINGASGTQGLRHANTISNARPSLQGGSGGGAGGGVCDTNKTTGVQGGGGAGGTIAGATTGAGGAGGNGYVWFEYYTTGA